ncbi:MAG: hypothetical protein ACHP65_01775 [Legionellales bacterium]
MTAFSRDVDMLWIRYIMATNQYHFSDLRRVTSLISSINQFNTYVSGGKPDDLQHYMGLYKNRKIAINKHFCLITIDSNDALIAGISALLKNLNIPKNEWGRYFGFKLTVYDLLVELKKQGHHQIDYILELIDGQLVFSMEEWLFIGVTLAIPAVIAVATTSIVALVQEAVTVVITLPVAGLFYHGVIALYDLSQDYFDKKKTTFVKIRDGFFVLAHFTVTATGYGIWMTAAATTMSPLIATLFVAASAIDVMKEVFCLIQNHIEDKNRPEVHDDDPLLTHKAHARLEFGFIKHRNAALINLVAALLFVGLMAAWCFVPGGMLVSVVLIVAIVTVHAIKKYLQKCNDSYIREQVATELKRVEEAYTHVYSTVLESTNKQDVTLDNEPTQIKNNEGLKDGSGVERPVSNTVCVSALSFFPSVQSEVVAANQRVILRAATNYGFSA